MKVVVVAKTRMGQGACIGAVTFDGRSLRLIPSDKEENDCFNQEYQVGDVWELTRYTQPAQLVPPHNENLIVHEKRPLPPVDDITATINTQMPPKEGGLDALFDGLTGTTSAGALYICERMGTPGYSTQFWRPDEPLVRDDEGKRIRYRYPTADGGRTLTFVGFQDPVPEIPAGTLLRVSLAHWWRPTNMPEGELRCYVQLSGWFEDTYRQERQEREERPENQKALRPLRLNKIEPLALLKQVFGYSSFREMQPEIIENVLAKRDTLAIMPTGSGKSLCYQLPALLFPGLTVVVSPLISLMEDQVQQLRELGITAVSLNSTLHYEEYGYISNQIRAGAVKLLYVAPETLLRPETLLLLEQVGVDCLTIDESHCISEWGHDFRPEYRQLVQVRQRLSDAVCLAVTATATERVQAEIKQSLAIDDGATFIASFDRENLSLRVEPKTDALAQTMAFLNDHRDEAGIIYCATRRQVDELTAHLQQHGWPVLPYHAGLDDQARRHNQRRFTYEEGQIVVATIAFGMGINKSNVRFILHYDLPKNLESYYQQIGRAGRDGLPADCLLLFNYSDVQTVNYFIRQQAETQQIGARMRLEALLAFAESSQCRRQPLLAYFGETYEAGTCDMCDNCLRDEAELEDLTIPAQKFLSCVKRTGELFGMSHVIDVLRGSRSKKVLQKGHDRLSTYNIGGEFSKKEWQYLARQFIQQGLLTQDMDHGSLKLTPQAYAVFKGEAVLGLRPDQPAAATGRTPVPDHDPALFAQLRAKRAELAQANGVPPYIIFSDRSLVEMATYFPQSEQSLGAVYGVGQAKLVNYAAHFLPIIQAYCRANDLAERPSPGSSGGAIRPSTTPGGTQRWEEVAAAYNAGHSLAELPELFGVKERTIWNYLWKAAQANCPLRPDGFLAASQLSDADQQKVIAAFADCGLDFLRPVYEALHEAVSYDELHLLRLYVAAEQMNN